MKMLEAFVVNSLIKEHNGSKKDTTCLETTKRLRDVVEEIAFPRDCFNDKKENAKARQIICDHLSMYCDFVKFDGEYDNIIAGWGDESIESKTLLGAHYDGPGLSPGADDNGSGLSVMIEVARQLEAIKPKNCVLVAFNAEEYNLLGSKDFVETNPAVNEAIILEMVGYFTSELGTQKMPEGFPEYPRGDFLAIIGNQYSKKLNDKLFKGSKNFSLPVKSIKIPFGIEDKIEGLSHVKRSDHYSFWNKKISAVMLTDTSEFRNDNYHCITDTPDTLNYEAMNQVSNILINYLKTK